MISSASRWHLISLPVSLITRIPGPPLGGFLLRAVLALLCLCLAMIVVVLYVQMAGCDFEIRMN